VFTSKKDFYIHIKSCGKDTSKRFQCPFCDLTYARKDDLKRRHIVDKHLEKYRMIVEDPSLIKEVDISLKRKITPAVSEWADETFINSLDNTLKEYLGTAVGETPIYLQGSPVKRPKTQDIVSEAFASAVDPLPLELDAGGESTENPKYSPYIPERAKPLVNDEEIQCTFVQKCPHGFELPVHTQTITVQDFGNGTFSQKISIQSKCCTCPVPEIFIRTICSKCLK
jgi:hypothetical protein